MDVFKELHVKVFNTGKLEIPGIRDERLLIKTFNLLLVILKNITRINDLSYDKDNWETVLINSNFNCGFYINRDQFLNILKYKYKIDCIFDACQYPGIQCKYVYDDKDNDKQYRISFMVFRTGSILIVGKCDEDVLYKIYYHIRQILKDEYMNICTTVSDPMKNTPKIKKIRRRTILVNN